MDHESVQATALKVVFDLLHVFGFEAFNITSHTGSSTKTPDKDIDVSSTDSICTYGSHFGSFVR